MTSRYGFYPRQADQIEGIANQPESKRTKQHMTTQEGKIIPGSVSLAFKQKSFLKGGLVVAANSPSVCQIQPTCQARVLACQASKLPCRMQLL
jgi:hypothetical protein